jgi:shikimate kinase
MRGVGEARGAVTVVNALPTGIGAAFGIELRVRAEVLLGAAPPPGGAPSVTPPSSATPLVFEAARCASVAFPADGLVPVEVSLASEVPPARGLKSSSAVASALTLAIARAGGQDPAPEEVASISAQASRNAGVSATGAFDDALAGLTPGLVVADNVHDRRVRCSSLPPGLEVGLWIPSGKHPASPEKVAAFRGEATAAHLAVESLLAGDWPRAMERNSELVERVMGYPTYAGLRAAVRHGGALAAGASGLGPAFAVVARAEELPDLIALLPQHEGELRQVRISTAGRGEERRTP